MKVKIVTPIVLLAMALLAAGCGDEQSKCEQRILTSVAGCEDEFADLKPYVADSPYSPVLAQCAKAKTNSASCSLSTLPPIALADPQPNIDAVMERVVVSHDWMGERLRDLLQEMPDDLITLFGAVTAVVIDDDIRPSYYWGLTGAIYLDPANLWLTRGEAAVINPAPDYRHAFAYPLNFRSFWRSVKDGQPAYTYYGLDSNENRALEEIVIPMATLLFHELAHANDILYPGNYSLLDLSDTVQEATNALYDDYPSTRLKNATPLQSEQMFHLASILYAGATPSEADKRVTATEVGEAFEPDVASDDYAYRSQYEDFAMLFEEAMMKIHFDVDRDTAFVSAPGENAYCNDHKIGWGVRNRIGADQVRGRAARVVNEMLPESDYTAEMATLPQPTLLPVGAGWCSSINQGSQAKLTSKAGAGVLKMERVRPDNILRPYDTMH